MPGSEPVAAWRFPAIPNFGRDFFRVGSIGEARFTLVSLWWFRFGGFALFVSFTVGINKQVGSLPTKSGFPPNKDTMRLRGLAIALNH